jgi:hypothetical protein
MASGVTDSNIADWLERNYQPPKLGNTAFKDAPLTAWLPHDESAGGELVVLRWRYGMSQGVGVTYAQAKARADLSGLKPAKVTVDYETFYSVATVDNTAIERAAGGNLSATNVLQRSINDAMEAHGDHLETFLFSDGWPAIGRIATGGISGSTITLDSSSDIENWEVDLEIVLAASRTTGDLRSSGASIIVSKVDRDTNIITFTAGVVATIGAAAAGDYAFIKSTRVDGAARQCMIGILGYIPESVGGSDSFGDGGLNRSVDPFRLAGARITIPAGTSVKQGFIDFFVRCGKYKIKPDAIFCSYERWGDLIKELGNDVRYVDIENKKYGLTISGVRLFTPKGEVPVIASSKCPTKYIWGLTRKSWKLFCVNGALIKPATRYSKALDQSSADAVELRYRSFAQLGCLEPHQNAIGYFA